jgi:hypothetical protein
MTLDELGQSLVSLAKSEWGGMPVYVQMENGVCLKVVGIKAAPHHRTLTHTDNHPFPLGGGVYLTAEL